MNVKYNELIGMVPGFRTNEIDANNLLTRFISELTTSRQLSERNFRQTIESCLGNRLEFTLAEYTNKNKLELENVADKMSTFLNKKSNDEGSFEMDWLIEKKKESHNLASFGDSASCSTPCSSLKDFSKSNPS